MEAFFVAGSADDPTFAEAELVGDHLVKSFPRIGFNKDMRHPTEWAEYRQKISRLYGFNHPGTGALVWRRDGRLVGGIMDFRRVLKDVYNLQLETHESEIEAITGENKDTMKQVAAADSWTPCLGKSKKEWDNGISFEGTWKEHHPTKGSVSFRNGSTYEGGLKGGKFHGHGKNCFPNGAKFVGAFAEGKREGNGRYMDADGNSFDGQFSRGLCHGKGARTWATGRTYTGDWVQNEATGRGVETLPVKIKVDADMPGRWCCEVLSTSWVQDGEVNEDQGGMFFGIDLDEANTALDCVMKGETIENGRVYKIKGARFGARKVKIFINDEKDDNNRAAKGNAHGHIEPIDYKTNDDWTAKDSWIFLDDVQFEHEKGEGEGDPPGPTLIDGKRVYRGEFLNGQYNGDGFMEYETGDTYEGKWVSGRREGPGIYTWAGEMLTFDGEFEADVPKWGLLRFENGFTTPYPGEVKLSETDTAWWTRGLRELALAEGGWLEVAKQRKAVTDMYDEYPINDTHDNVMARVLNQSLWNNVHGRLTAGGVSVHSCIAPGLDPKNTLHPLGLQACDSDCFLVFRELFDEVIRSVHKGFDPLTDIHPTDLDEGESWKKINALSPCVLEVAVGWKLQVDRCIGSLPCAKLIDLETRRRVEETVVGALCKMEDEALQGEYYPLEKSDSWAEKSGGMSSSEAEELRAIGALFDESDCSDVRDWPDARGVFVSRSKKLIVHINKEDHISFFCRGAPGEVAEARRQTKMEFKEMFELLSRALNSVEASIFDEDQQTFARNENLCFVTSSLAKIGSGMTAELKVKIPKLTKRQSIDFIAGKTGLILTNVPIPAAGKKVPLQDLFVLSVPQALGTAETQVLNALIAGANQICMHEKALAGGRKKLWLLEEMPRILLVGAKEILADDATHASRLAQEFDLDLVTSEMAVHMQIDKNSKVGKTAKWYTEAGKPVPREIVREAFMEILKATEAQKVRFAGAGVRGWICSGFPASIEELEMLIAAEVKPNKIISLRPDDAVVENVVSRRLGRRREKYTKKVFYLEDQPSLLAADRSTNSPFEKLSEDRGELPRQEAENYMGQYDKFFKALNKLGTVESVVAADTQDQAKQMTEFVASGSG